AGQLLALGLQIILQQFLTSAQLTSWGWRIAFGVGALGALVVMWLRRSMDESTSFEAQRERPERGTLRELAQHPKACLLVVGLTLGGTAASYTYTTYRQKFLVNTRHIHEGTVGGTHF